MKNTAASRPYRQHTQNRKSKKGQERKERKKKKLARVSKASDGTASNVFRTVYIGGESQRQVFMHIQRHSQLLRHGGKEHPPAISTRQQQQRRRWRPSSSARSLTPRHQDKEWVYYIRGGGYGRRPLARAGMIIKKNFGSLSRSFEPSSKSKPPLV